MRDNRKDYTIHLAFAFVAAVLCVLAGVTLGWYVVAVDWVGALFALAAAIASAWLFIRMVKRCADAFAREIDRARRFMIQREMMNHEMNAAFNRAVSSSRTPNEAKVKVNAGFTRPRKKAG